MFYKFWRGPYLLPPQPLSKKVSGFHSKVRQIGGPRPRSDTSLAVDDQLVKSIDYSREEGHLSNLYLEYT